MSCHNFIKDAKIFHNWTLCFSSHVQVECRGKREEVLHKLVPRSWNIGGLALPRVWPLVKRSAWLSHMFGPFAGPEYISPLPCFYNRWDTTAQIHSMSHKTLWLTFEVMQEFRVTLMPQCLKLTMFIGNIQKSHQTGVSANSKKKGLLFYNAKRMTCFSYSYRYNNRRLVWNEWNFYFDPQLFPHVFSKQNIYSMTWKSKMELNKLNLCLFKYTTTKHSLDVRRNRLFTSYGDFKCTTFYYYFFSASLHLFCIQQSLLIYDWHVLCSCLFVD